ncbi:MAG: UrcA family protein [Halieaceae bacterium]|jgi:UrcA family protein|nr:UrcA family protein [Halieaceae bacterium]
MKTFATRTLSIAAFGIAVSLALPGAAEEAPEAAIPAAGTGIQTISIQYAPAQLNSDEGRAELYGKIRHAAREVCGPTGLLEAGGLRIASRNRKCIEQAMSAAMGQVESNQLAAMGY